MIAEYATNTVAVGAITSQFWLPTLHAISAGAAIALPILGCMWFALQISLKIYNVVKKR